MLSTAAPALLWHIRAAMVSHIGAYGGTRQKLMQVIGICRFSYPAIGGFQVEHSTSAERAAYLYAPKRLASRFATFETLTLPCLRAQTDKDFTFLIVIGNDLPAEAEARLRDLVSDLPQVVIQSHAPGPHRKTMRDAINSVRRPENQPCLQFRLDDDDAVSIHFIKKLRALAKKSKPLLQGWKSVALDFNQGYIIQPGSDTILAADVRVNYWTPALALMFPPRVKQSVMNFSHHRVAKNMPAVTYPGEDMFLRGFSDYNDSRQTAPVRPFDLKPVSQELRAKFRDTFNVDLDHMSRVFSTLP